MRHRRFSGSRNGISKIEGSLARCDNCCAICGETQAFGLGLLTEHVWCGPNAKAHDFGLCASCPKAACRTAVPGTVEFVQVIARNSPIPTQVASQLSTTIWTSLELLPTREVLTLRETQMRVEPCKRVFRLRLWSHFRSRLIGPFLSPPWLLERKGAPLQALPFLRWCNAAVASAPAEAPVDETSLNLMPGALKGAIAPSGRLASRCATLSARRANATYMASVCSDRQCAAAVFAPGFAAKSAASRQRRTRTPWWKPLCLGAKKCMGKCQYDEALALSTAKGSAAARGCQDSARLR